jgi:hypothetical protein
MLGRAVYLSLISGPAEFKNTRFITYIFDISSEGLNSKTEEEL